MNSKNLFVVIQTVKLQIDNKQENYTIYFFIFDIWKTIYKQEHFNYKKELFFTPVIFVFIWSMYK